MVSKILLLGRFISLLTEVPVFLLPFLLVFFLHSKAKGSFLMLVTVLCADPLSQNHEHFVVCK